MSKIYFLFISLIFLSNGFSQNKLLLNGKVISENASLSKVEIINNQTKKMVISNETGEFSIEVSRNDLLIIVAKNFYIKKVYITSLILQQKNISISLEPIANELKEVIVKKEQLVSQIAIAETARINSYNSTMQANRSGVYTGEIINGMDFIAIGKMVGKLFKKKKKKRVEEKGNFKEYIAANTNQEFLFKTLQLKEVDYFRFLDFCEADPIANQLIKEENDFEILNFLVDKKEAFDKL